MPSIVEIGASRLGSLRLDSNREYLNAFLNTKYTKCTKKGRGRKSRSESLSRRAGSHRTHADDECSTGSWSYVGLFVDFVFDRYFGIPGFRTRSRHQPLGNDGDSSRTMVARGVNAYRNGGGIHTSSPGVCVSFSGLVFRRLPFVDHTDAPSGIASGPRSARSANMLPYLVRC